jgi:transcription antitermination protein NusB
VRDLPGGRRKSREILFRVMFEAEIGGEEPRELLDYALGRYHLTEDGRDYAVRVLQRQNAEGAQIDERIRARLANWEMHRLSAVVRTVLRLAVAELREPSEVPARVVLDQAIELAKRYGEEGSDAFVNGVLDPIAVELRPEELGGKRGGA